MQSTNIQASFFNQHNFVDEDCYVEAHKASIKQLRRGRGGGIRAEVSYVFEEVLKTAINV